MCLKLQVIRCTVLSELVSVSEDKLREVRDILQSRKMRDEVTRLKDCFLGVRIDHEHSSRCFLKTANYSNHECDVGQFYSSLSIGETVRLRTTLINFFKDRKTPVAVLIQEGHQVSCTHTSIV